LNNTIYNTIHHTQQNNRFTNNAPINSSEKRDEDKSLSSTKRGGDKLILSRNQENISDKLNLYSPTKLNSSKQCFSGDDNMKINFDLKGDKANEQVSKLNIPNKLKEVMAHSINDGYDIKESLAMGAGKLMNLPLSIEDGDI